MSNECRLEKGCVGSGLDEFLCSEGCWEEAMLGALKRTLAALIRTEMDKRGLSKAAMARLMGTHRGTLDRLLDPERDVTLGTVAKAAAVLGKRIEIGLAER